MKKLLHNLLLVLAAAFLLCACEGEEELPYEEPSHEAQPSGEGYLLVDSARYALNRYTLVAGKDTLRQLAVLHLLVDHIETESQFYCAFWTRQLLGSYEFIRYDSQIAAWRVHGLFQPDSTEAAKDRILSGSMSISRDTVDEKVVYLITVEAASAQHRYQMRFAAQAKRFFGFPHGIAQY